jgi:trehalose-6-phosphate synthase
LEERRTRHACMLEAVRGNSIARWYESFIDALNSVS